uniref:Chitin-binding type-2 domain-containing protein n=1 Tax=Anopheles epiroticus TaxID=199890 RepID=A0A182PVA8_9DIPT
MKLLLKRLQVIACLVLLVATVQSVCAQQELDCNDPNSVGIFLPHPTDCRKYLNCWQGQLIEGSCPLGLYFDLERQVCEAEARVRCKMNALDSTTIAKP